MPIVAKLDELGKPAWIALMVLGFLLWWPLGLATLAFIYGSGRMSCWNHHHGAERWQRKMDRMQEKMDRVREKMAAASWWGNPPGGWANPPSSGNRAFDEYRMETLRRLEDEQKEFRDFLDRLRHAKDKAEFDQFMAERRSRPQANAPEQPPHQG